ncbi:MAG: hypothetical protein JNK48_17180 [Bryobacterales bacterium]|nr:hypothetical protein [Bryobacterales bacterium]
MRNFAILELTRLDDVQSDSRGIARMLGNAVDEANIALSRLCRLGLLRMEGNSWNGTSQQPLVNTLSCGAFHCARAAEATPTIRSAVRTGFGAMCRRRSSGHMY